MSVPFSATPKGQKMIDYTNTIVSPLEERGEITPDFHLLKWKKRIAFFATTTEKEGGSNHRLLQGAEYMGKAHSISAHYIVKRMNMMHPVVFLVGSHEPIRQKLRGELYAVNAEMIHLMDRQFDLGRKCRRVKVKISLEDQNPIDGKYFNQMPWIEAIHYVADDDYFKDHNLTTYSVVQYKSNEKIRLETFYDYMPIGSASPANNPNTSFAHRRASMDEVMRMAAENDVMPITDEEKYNYLMGYDGTDVH